MTLIIGVKCSDGIVIGADDAVTIGALDAPTARQKIHKLTLWGGDLLMGVSGALGVAQQLEDAIQERWITASKPDVEFAQRTYKNVLALLREAVWSVVEVELQHAAVAKPALGSKSEASAVTHSMFAFATPKGPHLVTFNQQATPEEAREMPFISIGKGSRYADPFLGFLREVVWKETKPPVKEGVVAVYWSLVHVSRTSTGGVGNPGQIMVMEQEAGTWKGREVSSDDLMEQQQFVDSLEEEIRALPKRLLDPKGVEESPPPRPPDAATLSREREAAADGKET